MTTRTRTAPSPITDPDWWRGAVIYQVYPRSFQDSDGDGTGDLVGITRRLDHIAKLGVDAIWLSPFFTSPMKDMGYDISDYTDVDPIFGYLADFDALVARAHVLGLKVIIDQVMNHTSDQHPWFIESRKDRTNDKADWYVWVDPQPDGTPPNNWLSVFGGPAWEWDGVRRQFYLHNFLKEQPDLNFHNPQVVDAILDTCRFWLDRGVDGFRIDTANFFFHDRQLRSNPPREDYGGPAGIGADAPETNPYGMQEHVHTKSQPEMIGFYQRFRAMLDEYGLTTSVGEIGDPKAIELTAEYTNGGDKLHMCYTFDLLSPRLDAEFISHTVNRFEKVVTDGWASWAFSNHDVPRHVTRFTKPGMDPAQVAKFALMVLAALRGTLCLYQGEEIAQPETDYQYHEIQDPYGKRFWPAFKGRDGCRTPMLWQAKAPNAGFTNGEPWLPIRAEHLDHAVDRQEADPDSVLNHYRAILKLRADTPALKVGDMERCEALDDGCLLIVRAHEGKRLLLVLNYSAEPAAPALPSWAKKPEQLALPGFKGRLDGITVSLQPLDVYAAWIA